MNIVSPQKERRGIFVVVDGLDGIGKGFIERVLIEYEQKLHRSVFDTVSFSRANRKGLPELKDFWNPPETYFDTVITAEPTYADIGHAIRTEIIAINDRKYSSSTQIQAYSLDRLISMLRVVIPALKNGLRVIQSRSMASTLTYQSLKAKEEGKNESEIRKIILEHPGNKLQLEWAPDLLIIPTIKNISDLIKRQEARKKTQKDDKAIFENTNFQLKLKPMYESDWLRKLFAQHGTSVKYLDAGISHEETRRQALQIYTAFLESCHLA